MSREYVVGGQNITVLSQAVMTLVHINPVATQVIEILRAWVSQHANTTSAQQAVRLGSKAAVQGTTYVSTTPAKLKIGDPVSTIVGGTTGAAGLAGINPATEGAGTVTPIIVDAFNVLNGWLWVPTPPETIMVTGLAAQAFVLQLSSTPGTLTSWNFGVVYRELG